MLYMLNIFYNYQNKMQQTFKNIINRDLINTIKKYIDIENDVKNFDYTLENLNGISLYYDIFKPRLGIDINTDIFEKIIKQGYLKVAKWYVDTVEIIRRDTYHVVSHYFHDACMYGRLSIAKWVYKFFELTEDDVKDDYHHRAFSHACMQGHFNVVKWLAKKFTSVSGSLLEHHNNAFSNACEGGYIEICEWMLTKFELEKYPRYQGREIIYVFKSTCIRGNIQGIRWLFNRFDIIKSLDDYELVEIFEKTCSSGNLEAAFFICANFEIDKKQVSGNGAFVNACYGGHLSIAQWLYAKFKIRKENLHIERIFCILCDRGRLEILKFITQAFSLSFDRDTLLDAFFVSYYTNHLKICQWLINTFKLSSILLDKAQTELQKALNAIRIEARLSSVEELISNIIEHVTN